MKRARLKPKSPGVRRSGILIWGRSIRFEIMRLVLSASMIAATLWLVLWAAVTGEPALIAMFPFGGQRGAEYQATIRGRSLDRISAIWFDCEQLSATVVSVENDKSVSSVAASRKSKKSSSTGPLQLLTLTV